MYKTYGMKANFYIVYILEAHPEDGWTERMLRRSLGCAKRMQNSAITIVFSKLVSYFSRSPNRTRISILESWS